MSLKACNECGNQISKSVKACPNCGHEQPKPSTAKRIGKWVLYFIAITVVMQIILVVTGTKKSFSSTEIKDTKPSLNRMVAECEVNWEIAFKSKMREPNSLDWDRKNTEFGMYKGKTVIAVPYRAKNGMGGMALDKALCEIDAETREVKAALK